MGTGQRSLLNLSICDFALAQLTRLPHIGIQPMLMHTKIAIAIASSAVAFGTSLGFSQTNLPQINELGGVGQRNLPARSETPNNLSVVSSSDGVVRLLGAKLVCLHKIQVAAQSDGLIQALLTDEGEFVKKGDVLLKIDNRVAAAELEVARKELEAAQKQAAQTADVEYAKKASAVSDIEFKNENELLGKGSATRSQVERKRLEAERARLGIDVAMVKHETEGLAAEVAAAKLEAAKVRLDLFSVLAPYDGVIVQRLRDEGEFIRGGEPVLRLLHMNEMKIEGMVDLEELNKAGGNYSLLDLEKAPIMVIVRISPTQNYEIPTNVEFVSPEILSKNIRVSAKVQNQKIGDTWLLRDGMSADVEMRLPNKR